MLALLLLLGVQDPAPDPALPLSRLEDVVIEGQQAPARGRVSLECDVMPTGRLENCRILSETPEGAGFGEAALAAASRVRLSSSSRPRPGETARVAFTATYALPDAASDP